MNTPKKIKILHSILVTALLGLVIWFQITYDQLTPPFTTKLSVVTRTLLPEKILPFVSLGFTNIITDYYWLSSVQDLVAWDGKDVFYLNYFRNITTLDPKFEYPYLFNILVVPKNKNVAMLDEVAKISERGLNAIPESWQIPFYLGTQYYLFTRQYQPAESYLKIAAENKKSPDGVFLLYSTFVGKDLYTREEKMNLAKKLIKVIYNNTDNETIKKMAEKGFKEESITQMLEKGIIAYKERFKKYPTSVEDMVNANLIKLPEDFYESFTVRFSHTNGAFTIEEKEGE